MKKDKKQQSGATGDAQLEKIKREFERLNNSDRTGGDEFDKLPQGKNARRFVKSDEDEAFYIPVCIHGGVGDGVSVYSVRCADDKELTSKELKEAGYIDKNGKRIPCRVCLRAKTLVAAANKRYPRGSAEGKTAFREIMQEYGSRARYLSWVIPLVDGVKQEPKALEYGAQIHKELITMFMSPEFCGDFVSPKEGFMMYIVRTGEGRDDTKYTVKQGKLFPISTKICRKLPSLKTKVQMRWPLPPPATVDEYLQIPKDGDDAPEKTTKKKKKRSSEKKNDSVKRLKDKLGKKHVNPYR